VILGDTNQAGEDSRNVAAESITAPKPLAHRRFTVWPGTVTGKPASNRAFRVPGADIEDVILGDTNQAGEDSRNVARNALLLAGLPVTVTFYTTCNIQFSFTTSNGTC
jgi:hypothetical protein